MGDRFINHKWRETKRWRRLEVPSECRMMLRKGSPLNPLPLLVLGVLLSTLRLLFPIAWLISDRESQKEKRAHQNGCGLHQQLRMQAPQALWKNGPCSLSLPPPLPFTPITPLEPCFQGSLKTPFMRTQWTLLSPYFLDLSWELPLLLETVPLTPETPPFCFSFSDVRTFVPLHSSSS